MRVGRQVASMSLASRTRVRLVTVLALAASLVTALLLLSPDRAQRRQRSAHATASTIAQRRWRLTIGRSVQGRRIEAVGLGGLDAVRAVLVVGCIHGNESAGIAITRRLQAATAPSGTAMWIVPSLNPDGVAAGTRQNANGVDLNRNFPWHWRPLGAHGDPQYSGTSPLSEPEARAARRLIVRLRPQITIWFHQPAALVDMSGGNPDIERDFAGFVDLPVSRLARYPGSAVNWENAQLQGSTAFVVELPPGPLPLAAVARYAHAVLALAGSPARPGRART